MDSINLVLYIIIDKIDMPSIQASGILPLRYVSAGKDYIGLRENLQDALDRFKLCYSVEVNPIEHIALKFTFTALGLAHYTLQFGGSSSGYASVLRKKFFYLPVRDWKVWHFFGDLPVSRKDLSGATMISSEFVSLDGLPSD